jgi:DNA-binding NarL/FixJ family response regulator
MMGHRGAVVLKAADALPVTPKSYGRDEVGRTTMPAMANTEESRSALVVPPAQGVGSAMAERTMSDRLPRSPAAVRTFTVLLVDDIPETREFLGRLLALGPQGWRVVTAKDGVEAVEATWRVRPDLVLMDIAMPGMSGIDAARQIKAVLPAQRIVMMSIFDDSDYFERAVEAGAAAYIAQPFSAEELSTAIAYAMSDREPPVMFGYVSQSRTAGSTSAAHHRRCGTSMPRRTRDR